jgi:hypothetical protein
MRIGSVGYSLSGTEQVPYRSETTLLEFDVVLLDLEQAVDEYHSVEDYSGRPLVSESDSPRMLADIRRRRGELEALLSLAKTLVVFVPSTLSWYVHTGERRNDGTPGRPRMTRLVDRRTASALLPFQFQTVTAAGTQVVLRAGEPFASFWRRTSSFFAYRGYVTAPDGVASVVIRGTDFGVAGVIPQEAGRVILLPDLGDGFWGDESAGGADPEAEDAAADERARVLVESLEELVVALAGGDSTLPPWTERFLVPGEAELRGELEARRTEVTEALEAVDRAQRELVSLQSDKLLFAGTGDPLRRRVGRAFEALGATVDSTDIGRSDLIIRWRERVAVTEVKGVAGSAGERDAAQLEKWAASYLQEHGVAPKAILVINAFRDSDDLEARIAPAFPDQMRPYAEARGQCLVTSLQLLAMEIEVRSGRAEGDALLGQLFETAGVFGEFTEPTSLIEDSSAEAAER